jgi:hypothetical protein
MYDNLFQFKAPSKATGNKTRGPNKWHYLGVCKAQLLIYMIMVSNAVSIFGG